MGRDRGEGIFRIRQPIAESGAPDIDIFDWELYAKVRKNMTGD